MNCPSCGSDSGFTTHEGAGMCPDTGDTDGEYLTCISCDAETDMEELERFAAVERKPAASEAPVPERRERA